MFGVTRKNYINGENHIQMYHCITKFSKIHSNLNTKYMGPFPNIQWNSQLSTFILISSTSTKLPKQDSLFIKCPIMCAHAKNKH